MRESQCSLYRANVRHVLRKRALADLELEGVVAAHTQHLLGLGNVARGIAARQRPEHRQSIDPPPANKFAYRHADPFALRVQQGRFNRALGKIVANDVACQKCHRSARARGGLPFEQRRKIRIDGDLDRLRAFRAIRKATDRGRLTNPHDTVRAGYPDKADCLRMHRSHGQHMRADRRQIENDRLDGNDRGDLLQVHAFYD